MFRSIDNAHGLGPLRPTSADGDSPSTSPTASRRSHGPQQGPLVQLAQMGSGTLRTPPASSAFPKQVKLDLSDRGLNALPNDIHSLSSIVDLDLSGNQLKKFPVDQLLGMTSLQNLRLSMEATTGAPVRKSHEALADQGVQLAFVRQGNSFAKVIDVRRSQNMALYTTDLDPCLALSIMQGNTALMMHVDSFSGHGAGRISAKDVLSRHIKPDRPDTQIMLVGANAQGSAANVRGILSVLKGMGLEHCITMASLGNQHTSATLHASKGQGYVGFG